MTSQVKVFEFRAGELKAFPIKAQSFDEALLKSSRGVYTVFRVYAEHKVLRFQDHMDRLEQSASILGVPFLLNPRVIREAVGCAIRSTNTHQPRICLLIPFAAPKTLLLMLEELIPLSEKVYQQGVRVEIAHLQRERPSAKDSNFVFVRNEIRSQHPKAHEILMCDEDGHILEGLSSNFYAVMNGELRTAKDNVLAGISRSILLEVTDTILPVHFEPICLSDCYKISEALLTSSSRGVIPVIEIGKIKVGSGKPGPVTSQLRSLFDARVEAELEPLFQHGNEG